MVDEINFNLNPIACSPSPAVGTIHVRLSDKIFTQWSSQCLTIAVRQYVSSHM